MKTTDKLERLRDHMVNFDIITEAEEALVTSIIGRNLDTYESMLFARTGCRSYEQLFDIDEEDEEEPECVCCDATMVGGECIQCRHLGCVGDSVVKR